MLTTQRFRRAFSDLAVGKRLLRTCGLALAAALAPALSVAQNFEGECFATEFDAGYFDQRPEFIATTVALQFVPAEAPSIAHEGHAVVTITTRDGVVHQTRLVCDAMEYAWPEHPWATVGKMTCVTTCEDALLQVDSIETSHVTVTTKDLPFNRPNSCAAAAILKAGFPGSDEVLPLWIEAAHPNNCVVN